jgi:putative transcriptional regulator
LASAWPEERPHVEPDYQRPYRTGRTLKDNFRRTSEACATMKAKSKGLSVAQQIRKGLEELIRHANGEITLKTTTLEMPDRPPEVEAEEVTKLRLKNGMSHAVFAQVLNVSTKTVQSWEQGQRKPSQAALRLLQVFRQNPSGLLEIVGMSGPTAKASVGKPAVVIRRTSGSE